MIFFIFFKNNKKSYLEKLSEREEEFRVLIKEYSSTLSNYKTVKGGIGSESLDFQVKSRKIIDKIKTLNENYQDENEKHHISHYLLKAIQEYIHLSDSYKSAANGDIKSIKKVKKHQDKAKEYLFLFENENHF